MGLYYTDILRLEEIWTHPLITNHTQNMLLINLKEPKLLNSNLSPF